MGITTLAILVVAFAILLAAASQWIVDRLVGPELRSSAESLIGDQFSQPVSGLYGVLVAFLLAAALTTYQDLRTNLVIEINAMIDLGRVARSLPPPADEEIGAALREYTRSLLEDEWSSPRPGAHGNPQTTAALSRLWQRVAGFSPSTDRETNLHAQALELVSTIGAQRRSRIAAAHRTIPAIVWWILGIGGLITVGIALFSSPAAGRFRPVLVAALAVIVALSLYTLYVLSHPFGRGLPVIDLDRVQELQSFLANPR